MPFGTQPVTPPVDDTAADTETLVDMGVVEEQPTPPDPDMPEPPPEQGEGP